MTYWQDRFTKLEEAQLLKGQQYYIDLEKQYRLAEANLQKEINYWYDRFAVNNQITFAEAKKMLNTKQLAEFKWTVEDYIKYGEKNALDPLWMKQLENASAKFHISRLEALKLQTQQQVEVLFGNQVDGIDKLARNIYKDSYYHSAYEIQKGFNVGWDLQSLNENQLEKIISKPWTVDNKTFKARCWTNKRDLVNTVHTELTQGIIRGDAPDKAIKAISKKFSTSKANAGRLVMTESAFFASAAQKDAFMDLDVERFEIVATLDLHTSELCQSLDGEVFAMKDYEVGVTAPPFHPWCRTVTVPYFDDNYGSRAARGADGKTYYVPSDMKYADWYDSFINGGSKGGLNTVDPNAMMKQQQQKILDLKDAIFKTHETILTSDHQTEFINIMDQHSDERILNLYDKLSVHFNKSDYYKPGTGWYLSFRKKVEMNMSSNPWEIKTGGNLKGAFHTKFHEEFHQLDHILSKTEFAHDVRGKLGWAEVNKHFTDINDSVIGQKMIDAIDEDVLNVINNSIDWYNGIIGNNKIKHLKSLNRISSDAYTATIGYLKHHYPTEKDRALIAMFTDAMGLTTKDRLNPHGNGFWGHDKKYNKDRGKSGATSETWASYGALKFRNHPEELKALQKIIPNTLKVYDEVFEDVLDYAMNNDLNY